MGLKLRYFYEVKTAEFGVAKCNEKVFTFFHKQAEEASADILFSPPINLCLNSPSRSFFDDIVNAWTKQMKKKEKFKKSW